MRNSVSVDYSKLVPGQEISRQTYILDDDVVSKYVDAVSDESSVESADGSRRYAPPMAIAALSLRGVINDLAIPGGTLHAGQEIEFVKAVPVGDTLNCKATLAQNSTRGEWRFMVVQLETQNGQGQTVMQGKSTIMVPV
jgi:acyl dehydratase